MELVSKTLASKVASMAVVSAELVQRILVRAIESEHERASIREQALENNH